MAHAPDFCEGEAHYVVDLLAKQSGQLHRRRWPLPDDSALLTGQALKWCLGLKNITPVDLGDGIHFVQETCPHRVGAELSKWYAAL